MPRQFNLNTFLQQAPNHLLRQYLAGHQVGLDLDWDSIAESPCDEVCAAVTGSPLQLRGLIESELEEINRHATPVQIERIISTGKRIYPPVDVAADLSKVGDNVAQCLWLFLNHNKLFDSCLLLEQVDGHRYEYRDSLPAAVVPIDDHAVDRFRQELISHYSETHAMGENCIIERIERDGQHLFFCHVRDHARTGHEFVDGDRIERTTRWPVFDVILVYDPARSTLQTYVPGSKKVAEQIEQVFGKSFLGDDLTSMPKTKPLYDLSCLLDLNHVFELHVDDSVERVVVRELKLEYLSYPAQFVTFAVPVDSADGRAVSLACDLLGDDDALEAQVKPVRAKLTAVYRRLGRAKQRRRTFTVSCPTTCDLTIDKRDEELKLLLRRWKIDVIRCDNDDSQPT